MVGDKSDDTRVDPPARSFMFGIVLVVGAGLLVVLLLVYGVAVFEWVAGNLPLVLPLAVTVLSVFTRASDLKNYEALLRISNDVAIGIISFDIWAISTARADTTGGVLVNATTMIRGEFVIPLLLAGLITAVGCVVLTNYPFTAALFKRRAMLAALVTAAVVYVAPFGLLEAVPEAQPAGPRLAEIKRYTVAIGYHDPGLLNYASTALRDHVLLTVERDIEATSASNAEAQAIKRFLDGADSNQTKTRTATGDKVEIRQQAVVSCEVQ